MRGAARILVGGCVLATGGAMPPYLNEANQSTLFTTPSVGLAAAPNADFRRTLKHKIAPAAHPRTTDRPSTHIASAAPDRAMRTAAISSAETEEAALLDVGEVSPVAQKQRSEEANPLVLQEAWSFGAAEAANPKDLARSPAFAQASVSEVREHLRKVDIEQISTPDLPAATAQDVQSVDVGRTVEANLASKLAMMQVSVPEHLAQREEARGEFLELSPRVLTLRIGESTLGEVEFRSEDQSTLAVSLSGILQILSDRFPPGEFNRLTASSNANTFVSLEQLRESGLTINYDPIYDELRLSA